MKLIHTIEDLQRNLTEARAKGEKIGLVPTMGALHEPRFLGETLCSRK